MFVISVKLHKQVNIYEMKEIFFFEVQYVFITTLCHSKAHQLFTSRVDL